MNLPVILRDEAEADLDESARWYEQRSPGLGIRFLAAVKQTFDRIATNPQRFATVERGVREAPVRIFPYVVEYIPLEGKVEIIAVYHTSRDRETWIQRLDC